MFKGHQFIKLVNNDWVLDLTEYQGYKVKFDKEHNVIGYKEAFTAEVMGSDIVFNKQTRVPIKVLKEAGNQIRAYENMLNENIDIGDSSE